MNFHTQVFLYLISNVNYKLPIPLFTLCQEKEEEIDTRLYAAHCNNMQNCKGRK